MVRVNQKPLRLWNQKEMTIAWFAYGAVSILLYILLNTPGWIMKMFRRKPSGLRISPMGDNILG